MLKLRNSIGLRSQICLEKLDDKVDTSRVWSSIRENIKPSAKESLGCCEIKQQKP